MKKYSISINLCLLFCLYQHFDQTDAKPVVDGTNYIRDKLNYYHTNDMRNDLGTLNKISEKSVERPKRQFDFTIDADHEDGLGTNLMASASVNLFKNDNTRLDGTARYSQQFSEFSGHGKAKIGGSLHFSHNY